MGFQALSVCACEQNTPAVLSSDGWDSRRTRAVCRSGQVCLEFGLCFNGQWRFVLVSSLLIFDCFNGQWRFVLVSSVLIFDCI